MALIPDMWSLAPTDCTARLKELTQLFISRSSNTPLRPTSEKALALCTRFTVVDEMGLGERAQKDVRLAKNRVVIVAIAANQLLQGQQADCFQETSLSDKDILAKWPTFESSCATTLTTSITKIQASHLLGILERVENIVYFLSSVHAYYM